MGVGEGRVHPALVAYLDAFPFVPNERLDGSN